MNLCIIVEAPRFEGNADLGYGRYGMDWLGLDGDDS